MRSIDYNICYKINKIHDQNSILLVSDEYRDENLLINSTSPAKVSDRLFHLRIALLFCFELFAETSVDSFLDVALIHESSDEFRFRLRNGALSFHAYLLFHKEKIAMLHEHEKDYYQTTAQARCA